MDALARVAAEEIRKERLRTITLLRARPRQEKELPDKHELRLRIMTYRTVVECCGLFQLSTINQTLNLDNWVYESFLCYQPTMMIERSWKIWFKWFTRLVRFLVENNRLPQSTLFAPDEKRLRQFIWKSVMQKYWEKHNCPTIKIAWIRFFDKFRPLMTGPCEFKRMEEMEAKLRE